jgi:prolyl oligopeptidase
VANQPISPPPAAKRQAVDSVYHGISVPDPYRWLEDGTAEDTQTWVAQQNSRTRQALDARPNRGQWHERLVALMATPVVGGLNVCGDHLFVLERFADAEQFALVLRSAIDPTAPPITLVDPALLAADAAVAIDWFEPSPDGALVAYGTSEAGTEDSVLKVLRVADQTHLLDTIAHTRAASVAWLPDSSGFYYTAYPEGDQYNRRVLLHHLGSDPANDAVVWADPDAPQAWPSVDIAPDGRQLAVSVMVGWGRSDVFLLDIANDVWTTVIAGEVAATAVDFVGDDLLISTTFGAPRGRIAIASRSSPTAEHWVTIVPESAAVIGAATVRSGEIVVVVTEQAVDRLERFTLAGERAGDAPDLGVVSIAGLDSSQSSDHAFAIVAGFDQPATLVRLTGASSETWLTAGGLPIELTVEQLSYPSLDGTSIGMFIIHRADVAPGASTPTILNGYGGFAISETPVWSPMIAAWCEAGGVYAIAGLRGGYEHGEEWHLAGRRALKQNVFDDFHAGADWLVSTGRASRDRLAIAGGSNGGLLVGVALTQRPDLCRAVWCAVPLLDMIRYPEFLIARLWTDEYGDPDIEDEFGWLHAYSPYHHVSPGVEYPAVLLSTAEGDTRVDPLHARKMAAALQWTQQANPGSQTERPVLLFQDGRSGHGAGKPASKKADEAADVLTFLSWQLGDWQ